MLYDSIGDGDYLLAANNDGLLFNGSYMAFREDTTYPIGTAYVKLFDVAVAEWARLEATDGQLKYISVVPGYEGTRNVVVNINKTNANGIQAFQVIDHPDNMFRFYAASQSIVDEFPLITLDFTAEGFYVTHANGSLRVTSNTVFLGYNAYVFEVSSSGYFVSDPPAFRAAIEAVQIFNVTNAEGINSFLVFNNPEGASLEFKSASLVTEGFPQLSLTANADEGFGISHGDTAMNLNAGGLLLGHLTYNIGANYSGYVVSDPPAFRATISAQQTLVSGTNIKTINGESILGSGNLVVSGGGGGGGATISDIAYLALALGGP
jgi:hypothetical protein